MQELHLFFDILFDHYVTIMKSAGFSDPDSSVVMTGILLLFIAIIISYLIHLICHYNCRLLSLKTVNLLEKLVFSITVAAAIIFFDPDDNFMDISFAILLPILTFYVAGSHFLVVKEKIITAQHPPQNKIKKPKMRTLTTHVVKKVSDTTT